MTAGNYKYDFFMLNHDEDLARSVEVLNELEKANLKGYLEERDAEFGQSNLTNLSTALNSSRYILLLISRHAVTDNWWERKAHISIQHRLESGVIVPVILPGMTEELIPECLNMLNPVYYEDKHFMSKLKLVFEHQA